MFIIHDFAKGRLTLSVVSGHGVRVLSEKNNNNNQRMSECHYLLESANPHRVLLPPHVQSAQLQVHGGHIQGVGRIKLPARDISYQVNLP